MASQQKDVAKKENKISYSLLSIFAVLHSLILFGNIEKRKKGLQTKLSSIKSHAVKKGFLHPSS